jgi:opacity protein-like surface antigen
MFGRSMLGACAALILGTATAASAEEAEKNPVKRIEGGADTFGQAGQLVISQDFQLQVDYNTAGSDNFTIVLAPGADYFLRDNLSLGVGLALGQIFQSGDDATSLGLNLRAGYNLMYDENISFWPKLTVGFVYNKTTTFAFGPDGTFLQLGLFAPAMLHPSSHFFVGLGPNVDILLGDSSGVSVGARTVIGGYF